MELDLSVGEIIKSLKKNNILENTLVVFTSDNGPWLNFGNHAGSTGGLREGKGTSFEGGQRVPTVMMWPDVIPKGKIANQLSSTIDLLPTITNIVDGDQVPCRHFGVILEWKQWEELFDRLNTLHIDYLINPKIFGIISNENNKFLI